MRAAFRRYLLLCLMLVLPLEAWASTAMLDCALAHGGSTHAMASSAEPPCHGDVPPDPATADHHCTHCAACVLASALPVPMALVLPGLPSAAGVSAHPPAAFSGFIPNGPERPPRTSHA